MAGETMLINRAPVLALWAAVVAERLGFSRDEALSLGKAVTALNAQSKGQRLGIYEKREARGERREARGERREARGERREARGERREAGGGRREAGGEKREARDAVELMGREIPVVRTPDGIRALNKGAAVSAESTRVYLESKFGEQLAGVRAAMEELARSQKPDVLAARAFALYAQFRPQIPDGVKGWGAKGKLDTDIIRSLAGTRKSDE
jgi:hypothetical protein